MACADLDELIFLSSGNTALTRRARRTGRTATAKELEENAIRLAVVAHIRHTETPYDKFLSMGIDKWGRCFGSFGGERESHLLKSYPESERSKKEVQLEASLKKAINALASSLSGQ